MNEILVNLDEIFMWAARASLYSVVVIAGIVLVQKLTRRALSAKWIYALWIVLLLRLIIPSGPESSWSLWNLTPQNWTQQTSFVPNPAPAISGELVTFTPSAAGYATPLLTGEKISIWQTLRTLKTKTN